MKRSVFYLIILLPILTFFTKCKPDNSLPETLKGTWYKDREDEWITGESEKVFQRSAIENKMIKIVENRGLVLILITKGTTSDLVGLNTQWQEAYFLRKGNNNKWYYKLNGRKVSVWLDENRNLVIKGHKKIIPDPNIKANWNIYPSDYYVKLKEEPKIKRFTDTIQKQTDRDNIPKKTNRLHIDIYYSHYNVYDGNYTFGDNLFSGDNVVTKNKDQTGWSFEFIPNEPDDRLVGVVIDNFVNKTNPEDRNPFGNNTDTANYFKTDSISLYNSHTISYTMNRVATKSGEYEYNITARIALPFGSIQELKSRGVIKIKSH